MPPSRTSESQGGSSRPRDTQNVLSRPAQSSSSTRHRIHRPVDLRAKERSTNDPYSEECKILQIANLHPMQRTVIDAIAKNPEKDQFVIAATGSGKSLLYEASGSCERRRCSLSTIEIATRHSSAVSGQELARLRDCGIAAEGRYRLNTPNAAQELDEQDQRFARGIQNLDLLPQVWLVTPHQLEYPDSKFHTILSGLCDKGLVRRFVFDEVHMLLPKYQTLVHLPNLRRKYPTIPLTVLSASVSPTTVQMLSTALGIKSPPHMFPLDRPNLYYEILPKMSQGDDKKDKTNEPTPKERSQLTPVVRLAKHVYPGGAGLVFCRTKEGCARFAKLLRMRGIGAEAYNSEQGASEAGIITLSLWKKNDPSVQVLVSTNALSNGTHKADVRFVVHTGLPSSGMDGYMQETGRAGRDGLDATCLLLYSFGDAFVVPQTTAYETHNLLALLLLITTTNCRRRSLLSHFGDKHFAWSSSRNRPRCCDVCDGMISPHPSLDVTSIAIRILRFCENRPELMKGRKELARTLFHRFTPSGPKIKREPTLDMWDKLIQWLIIEQYLEVFQPGEPSGGQVKLVKSPELHDLFEGGGRVYLPWALRFNDLNVRGEDDMDCRLRWTENVLRTLDNTPEEIEIPSSPTISESLGSDPGSPEL